ncbi:MAG: hypothetical protein ACREE7_13020, partial [Dongiaceae bacterium]
MAIGNATAAAATSERHRGAWALLLGLLLCLAAPVRADDVVVREGGATVYAAPSRKAPAVAHLNGGERLVVLGGGGPWLS